MDADLVIRAQRGDETAFAIITEAVVGRYHRIAYAILRDREAAQDATQAGLVRIWQKLPRLKDPNRFEAWAHKLLVHACYKEARTSRSSQAVTTPSLEPVAPDGFGAVADRDQLERAFGRLTLEQRAVVVLRIYFDLPPDDVAEALDVPIGTVKSRLHRALGALRAALEADARAAAPTATPAEVSR